MTFIIVLFILLIKRWLRVTAPRDTGYESRTLRHSRPAAVSPPAATGPHGVGGAMPAPRGQRDRPARKRPASPCLLGQRACPRGAAAARCRAHVPGAVSVERGFGLC